MLEKAQERGFDQLVLHDLERYPYPEQDSFLHLHSFDAIVCVGVMDFIQNPRQFLLHTRQYMKMNRDRHSQYHQPYYASPVAVESKARSSSDHRSVFGLTLPERHPHSDLSSFSRSEMEQLLRECGFWVERHERFMGYTDSQSGNIQYYHGWLCVLNGDGGDYSLEQGGGSVGIDDGWKGMSVANGRRDSQEEK
jgi:hypothetical protein